VPHQVLRCSGFAARLQIAGRCAENPPHLTDAPLQDRRGRLGEDANARDHADGRLLAVRLTVRGACGLHHELAREGQRAELVAEIRKEQRAIQEIIEEKELIYINHLKANVNITLDATDLPDNECMAGIEGIFWRYEWDDGFYPPIGQGGEGIRTGAELSSMYGYTDPDLIGYDWYWVNDDTVDVSFSEECVHEFYYWAKDNVCHNSTVYHKTFYVDNTPPNVNFEINEPYCIFDEGVYKVNNETKFCCVDGPDFDGHIVDFEELEKRNSIYIKELSNIALIQLQLEQYIDSENNYLTCLKHFKRQKDRLGQAAVLGLLGTLNFKNGDFERSLDFYIKTSD